MFGSVSLLIFELPYHLPTLLCFPPLLCVCPVVRMEFFTVCYLLISTSLSGYNNQSIVLQWTVSPNQGGRQRHTLFYVYYFSLLTFLFFRIEKSTFQQRVVKEVGVLEGTKIIRSCCTNQNVNLWKVCKQVSFKLAFY